MNRFSIIALVVLFIALASCSESTLNPEDTIKKDTETLEIQTKQMSLVSKMTATWCHSCGSWGWDLFNNIINSTNRKAVFMAAYCSSTSGFYNSVAQEMYNNFTPGYGLPTFTLNGQNETVYVSGYVDDIKTRDNIISKVNENWNKEPIAGAGLAYTINENTVSLTAKVKFFAEAQGEYYLAAYLIEDGAKGFQSTRGETSHHYVLRGTADNKSFGEMISAGNISEGFETEKSYTFNTDEKINTDKLYIAVIIWKKTESGFEFVNAAVK